MKPGERIIESRIAKLYGVNKIHVNEALKNLESELLLQYEPMKGYFVAGISRNDFMEIAKLRQVLETAVLEEFLQSATDDEIQQAVRFITRKLLFLKNGLNEDAVLETDGFFEMLYTRSPYQRMVKSLRQVRDYIIVMMRKSLESPFDIQRTINNSELLCSLLKERNVNLVSRWSEIRYQNIIDKMNR